MRIKSKSYLSSLCLIAIISCMVGCKSGAVNLFKPASPHEQYQRKLVSAGLDKTAMGTAWIDAAGQSTAKALSITIPFRETGYFSAERIPAAAYQFKATRGQKLNINLSKKPENDFMIFLDVWELNDQAKPKLITSADTLGNPIELDADEESTYLIRLQPELLKSGEYTLEITAGPSLGYPVKANSKSNIGSFFGAGRDGNSRKHEGVDIFAPFQTPAVAAAEGTVTRVNENNLGGLVVWMRPKGKDYSLYYAHLDKQIATEGQTVLPGDTIGLVGNTGNARTTPPHLHFGIYTYGGAIDPLPFINPVTKPLPKISASLKNLNATVRTTRKSALHELPQSNSNTRFDIPSGTVLHVEAASGAWYRAILPDGTTGFIPSSAITNVSNPLRKLKINPQQQLAFDQPDSLAAVKLNIPQGESVDLLGNFSGYHLIMDQKKQTGWIKDTGK